jgi:hypothetical protein
MREKLFLSYSTGDVEWRDRFLKHMRTMLSEKQLFVDKRSLHDGADWKAQLAEELTRSKCALLLLTPHYLEVGNFAQDEELPMLLAEHQKPDGLKLLPVLVGSSVEGSGRRGEHPPGMRIRNRSGSEGSV